MLCHWDLTSPPPLRITEYHGCIKQGSWTFLLPPPALQGLITLVIVLIHWAAGGGGGTGHGTNLLKRKWTWMSGGGASSFPLFSLGFSFFFLISFIPSTFCFLAVPISVVIPLPHLQFLPYFLSRVFILTFTHLLLVPL